MHWDFAACHIVPQSNFPPLCRCFRMVFGILLLYKACCLVGFFVCFFCCCFRTASLKQKPVDTIKSSYFQVCNPVGLYCTKVTSESMQPSPLPISEHPLMCPLAASLQPQASIARVSDFVNLPVLDVMKWDHSLCGLLQPSSLT